MKTFVATGMLLATILGFVGKAAAADEPFAQPNSNAKTIDLGHGVTMEFVWVPPGEFSMGSTSFYSENPVHEVAITKGFWIGKCEVTRQQYQTVTRVRSGKQDDGLSPVSHVSWNDAAHFVSVLTSNMAGRVSCRLPTEAEWEYACGSNCPKGWTSKDSGAHVSQVGTSGTNALGLCDMLGNVVEWCADWYAFDYYTNSPPVDPQGPETGVCRVLRGGCWRDEPLECTPTRRNRAYPENYDGTTGFRVVLSATGEKKEKE